MPIAQPQSTLCAATYRVLRASGDVVVFAIGMHRTSGFLTYLLRDPEHIFPPRFSLWHVQSNQPPLHALTPFAVSISFQTTVDLSHVEIRDASGIRSERIEDVGGTLLAHN
jgi:hypothetical protein